MFQDLDGFYLFLTFDFSGGATTTTTIAISSALRT
jgi:hypothetical protein